MRTGTKSFVDEILLRLDWMEAYDRPVHERDRVVDMALHWVEANEDPVQAEALRKLLAARRSTTSDGMKSLGDSAIVVMGAQPDPDDAA